MRQPAGPVETVPCGGKAPAPSPRPPRPRLRAPPHLLHRLCLLGRVEVVPRKRHHVPLGVFLLARHQPARQVLALLRRRGQAKDMTALPALLMSNSRSCSDTAATRQTASVCSVTPLVVLSPRCATRCEVPAATRTGHSARRTARRVATSSGERALTQTARRNAAAARSVNLSEAAGGRKPRSPAWRRQRR